ncbi:MAG TPA: NAD(P)(+) transhydrogenase (Re/Si-specific) subunit beta, partial [Gammaproteobacteria bacterium]|nr:NAD(P)(+) transhydrogenase (Re/Si-specific) subunit beta [Gammaproteobacteria bacterium]
MSLSPNVLDAIIQAAYFLAALLFILGLKRMSSPKGARGGIVWAGVGMLVATVITFLYPGMHNFGLILAGILVGGLAAWWSGKRVAMTAMPQMVALYNGMGGGAAAAIAAAELLHPQGLGAAARVLAVVGALIGTVSFSGSLIAFAKLQGLINRSLRFKGQQLVNGLVFLLAVAHAVGIVLGHDGPGPVVGFFVLSLLFGLLMTVPIGGADMPVVISLYNAFTGLAVAFEGFVLQNPAMIIAGMVVGSAGTLLTQLMAKAMNRSI